MLSPSYTGSQKWIGNYTGFEHAAEVQLARHTINGSVLASIGFEVYPNSGDLEIVHRSHGSYGYENQEVWNANDSDWVTDPNPIDPTIDYEDFRGAVKHQPGEIQYREYELASTKSTDSTQSPGGEEDVESTPLTRRQQLMKNYEGRFKNNPRGLRNHVSGILRAEAQAAERANRAAERKRNEEQRKISEELNQQRAELREEWFKQESFNSRKYSRSAGHLPDEYKIPPTAWESEQAENHRKTASAVTATIVGCFCEPADWIITAHEIADDPWDIRSYAGLVPLVPSTAKRLSKITEAADETRKLENATNGTKFAKEQLADAPNNAAHNAAQFEKYKDSLRRAMAKPHASDPKLRQHLDDLYRDNAKIGSGSTADAIRHELATGKPVGGVFHSQKGRDSITALQKWLKNNPNASIGDRAAAENVIRDLQNALGGN